MGAAIFALFFVPIIFGTFILWDSGVIGKFYDFVVYKRKHLK